MSPHQRECPYVNKPEPTCEVCGKDIDYCICPPCEMCGAYGDPSCYDGGSTQWGGFTDVWHGMKRSSEQLASKAAADEAEKVRTEEERKWWDAYAAEMEEDALLARAQAERYKKED